ncbi:MAG TPA: hypothetical protein VFM16_02115, partial [Holophagaceae bacterium]|nr:hypothetical protein [Holophagaceae bacterium]
MSAPRRAMLVHGMGRSPLSMLFLAGRLRSRGIESETFGYFAGGADFESIAGRLADRLSGLPEGYLAVGHSLGGLLLRKAISQLPAQARPAHLFLLGTPNHPSRLAQRLARRPIYRVLTGDAGQLLADADRMERLQLLDVPTTVVAGTAGPRWRGTPFGREPNDGIVALSQASLAGA